MAASALLTNTVSIKEWMAAADFVKHSLLKKLLPATNAVTNKEKNCFRNNYFGSQPFLMSCYFTKIFVYLPLTAAVRYFSIYNMIR